MAFRHLVQSCCVPKFFINCRRAHGVPKAQQVRESCGRTTAMIAYTGRRVVGGYNLGEAPSGRGGTLRAVASYDGREFENRQGVASGWMEQGLARRVRLAGFDGF